MTWFSDLGIRVLGFRVSRSGYEQTKSAEVEGLECVRGEGRGHEVQGLGFRDCESGFRGECLNFGVEGLGVSF